MVGAAVRPVGSDGLASCLVRDTFSHRQLHRRRRADRAIVLYALRTGVNVPAIPQRGRDPWVSYHRHFQ
jgi:hypothetical protein